ncbi:MAG: DUF2153 family protein [Candidatus Bathyarchaeia archaeon]
MSEWVELCEGLLRRVRQLSEKKDMDRLDIVRSMRFALYAMNNSLRGWLSWVDNPEVMVSFTREELAEMNEKITRFSEAFLKYDIEATRIGAEKSLRAKRLRREQAERRRSEGEFYV